MLGLHFPFRFDPELLLRDLATARNAEWPPHYNERDYGGGWTGVALRSANGESGQLAAGPFGPGGKPVFSDTPLLALCPYFREVLSVFQCPLKSARLLSLAPQSFIREHSDRALGYEDGEIRIHVPIQTNPDVEFYVDGERLLLEAGHSYYINVNLPHRVNNRGSGDRVHLVIDAEVDEWVRALFHAGVNEQWNVPRCAQPARNVDEYRRHVLSDSTLRETLLGIEDDKLFASTALDLGRKMGFDINRGDIDSAFRSRPLRAGLVETAGFTSGWTPVRVFFRDRQPLGEWVYTGSRRFAEPFFLESVKIALRSPFAKFLRLEMPIGIPPESEPDDRTLAPSGFIFHMSRCGSTLISQMLASSARHLVLSEPPPLNDVIQAKRELPDLSEGTHIQWLRWIVKALGQRRTGEEGKYFIKMDAWHIRSLPLIRAAFPDTPWIFVYRDPLEVMMSQMARPGQLSIPGAMNPGSLGLEPADVTGLAREEWCARVIAGIMRAALAARTERRGLFIPYRVLPEAVLDGISRHFGISLSSVEAMRAREVSSFDARNPGLPFDCELEEKHVQATPAVRKLCGGLLDELYRELNECARPVIRLDGKLDA